MILGQNISMSVENEDSQRFNKITAGLIFYTYCSLSVTLLRLFDKGMPLIKNMVRQVDFYTELELIQNEVNRGKLNIEESLLSAILPPLILIDITYKSSHIFLFKLILENSIFYTRVPFELIFMRNAFEQESLNRLERYSAQSLMLTGIFLLSCFVFYLCLYPVIEFLKFANNYLPIINKIFGFFVWIVNLPEDLIRSVFSSKLLQFSYFFYAMAKLSYYHRKNPNDFSRDAASILMLSMVWPISSYLSHIAPVSDNGFNLRYEVSRFY